MGVNQSVKLKSEDLKSRDERVKVLLIIYQMQGHEAHNCVGEGRSQSEVARICVFVHHKLMIEVYVCIKSMV